MFENENGHDSYCDCYVCFKLDDLLHSRNAFSSERYIRGQWIVDEYNRKTKKNTYKINFKDKIGKYDLSTEELLPYPKLVKALRGLTHYPVFVKSYDITSVNEASGVDMLVKFAEVVKSCSDNFKAEKALLDEQVEQLIQELTCEEIVPTIDHIKQWYGYHSSMSAQITVNEIVYVVSSFKNTQQHHCNGENYGDKPYHVLDLFSLLNLDGYAIEILAFVKNTPIMHVKHKNNWQNKGTSLWVDISRKEVFNKTEMLKSAKQHYALKELALIPVENVYPKERL